MIKAILSGTDLFTKDHKKADDVTNATALAELAVRLAASAEPEPPLVARGPGSQERDDSEGDPGYRLADPRLDEYFKVVDLVSTKYKRNGDGTESNDAVASCVQFVTHCIRATVDPDCNQMSPRKSRLYMDASPKWERVCECDRGEVGQRCEPGDVISFLDGSHAALFVGHDLIAARFPDADASTNVCEARYTAATYPACVTYDAERGYEGHESRQVAIYRFTGVVGGCIHPYVNVWKYLTGESDYLLS